MQSRKHYSDMPQIVLTVGVALDPASLAQIQAQLQNLGGGPGGAGGSPGQSALQQYRLQLAQMQQAGRAALSAQNSQQAQTLQTQKANDALTLAGRKALDAQLLTSQKQAGAASLAQQRSDASINLANTYATNNQTLAAQKFGYQQQLLAKRQAFQQQMAEDKQQAKMQSQAYKEFQAYVSAQKFYGAANLLNTMNLPGGKTVSGIGNIVQMFGGALGVGPAALLGAGVTAVGAGINYGRESLDKYRAVQSPIALLRALTGSTPSESRALQAQGRQLSLGTGISQEELAQASYFISSSGFSGRGAGQVLNASAIASQAGLGSTKNFADLLTSSLQAYGEEASRAMKYTDVFTATVREGKAEPEQLAKSLGLVLPIAAAAGVRIEEVGAAIATITRTGSTAPQAVTQLKQTISNLIDPSKEAKNALKELGLAPQDIANRLKSEGLGSVLKDIESRASATGNRETVLSQIFGNIRAYTGVLSLARGEFDTYDAILQRITGSQGDTMNAAVIMGTTMEQQAQRIQAAFDGIQITLGEKLAPVTQEVGNMVEAMLLRINNDLGGDIGDMGKTRLTSQTRKANSVANMLDSASFLGGFLPGGLGAFFQGYGMLRNLGINPVAGGSPLTSTGFGMINPSEIPSTELEKQRLAAQAELEKAQKRLSGAGFLGGLNPYMKGDVESLTAYLAQIGAAQRSNFGSALPGGGARVQGEYSVQQLPGAPQAEAPSIYGKTPEPKDLEARNKLIIQTAVGQVDNVLKTSSSFEDAFSGAKDAFQTVDKLNKLKDTNVRYSYAVVNGQKVENESTVKSMALAGQYKDATDRLTKARNNLAKAEGAKKPNALTIENARLNVQNAERDLNLFNVKNPNASTVAAGYNADGTPIVGPDGKPAPVTTVSGTRRRGLSGKEQKDLEQAQAKIDAFNDFVDQSFQDRALTGFETALQNVADTNRDGVAPALAETTLQLENYLGATGKAKTTTYTLGLGLQALDNQLAGGKISYSEYLTKIKELQDGIKGLAPQITGAAPLTIEQAVKFKLVTSTEADLAGQVDELTKQANQFGKKGKGGKVNQGTEADDKKLMAAIDAKQKINGAGSGQIVQQLLAAQGIDPTQGLEIPIKASLSAAGVDDDKINESITQAREKVVKDAEKKLEPKPPVDMGMGQLTDNLTAPITSAVDAIVAKVSAQARTVTIPINVTTVVTTTTTEGAAGAGSGAAGTGASGTSGTGGTGNSGNRSSGGPGSTAIPHNASGGRVKRGKAVVVGDGGLPEMFMPDSDGMIVQGSTTKDVLKQLFALGYAVDGRGPYDFVPPPTTIAQVEELAKLYPSSELAKWVKRNQSKDTAFVHPFLGPQLTDDKLREIANDTPNSAARVYIAEKAKMDALIQQRDAPAIYRTEGAIEVLNKQIDGIRLSVKSARQAASAQYYDPSTGRAVGYGMNGIQSMSSLTAQSTADVLSERQRQENLARFKALQSTTQAIIRNASQISSDSILASIVTGAGGGAGSGASTRPYRPADPVPRSTRRPGGRSPVQQFAAGGLYTGGTLARVGELGPEYFYSEDSGVFINAANSSRLNSIGAGRFLDGASSVVSHSYDNRQTITVDARGASSPQAVRQAARRGVREGSAEARAKSRARATGRM